MTSHICVLLVVVVFFFCLFVFFFNDTATTEIYTLSLHDALPISVSMRGGTNPRGGCQLLYSLKHTEM